MNYRTLVILCCLMPYFPTLADTGLPPDVGQFINIAETCSHLAGEWDSSLPKEQQKEIERKASCYCAKTKKMYFKLTEKYKDNLETIRQIDDYKSLANSIID